MSQTTTGPRRNKFGSIDFETVPEALAALARGVLDCVQRWPDGCSHKVLPGALLCLLDDPWPVPSEQDAVRAYDFVAVEDVREDVRHVLGRDEEESEEQGPPRTGDEDDAADDESVRSE